jgi:hypothetical protein
MVFSVVSCCDASEHFEPCKAALDGITHFIGYGVVWAWFLGIGFGRDNDLDGPNGAMGIDIMGIVSFIGDELAQVWKVTDELRGRLEIMNLPAA